MSKKARFALAAVICALFLPVLSVQVCPAWTIRVVTETGQPREGVEVHQHWQYYGLTDERHAKRSTDSEGKVVFPQRWAHCSWISYLFGKAVSVMAVHSSFGPSATVEINPPKHERLMENWYGTIFEGLKPHVATTVAKELDTTFELIPQSSHIPGL